MSRVGEQAITIPSGVTVNVEGGVVSAKGPKGELSLDLPAGISAKTEGERVSLDRSDDSRETRSFHGLARSLVANMVDGVANGYSRDLEIEGVGFKAEVQGQTVLLSLGFSGPKACPVADGVTVTVEGGTRLKVSGPDKQKVGEVAARIRSYYPAEPYKGKGIRYAGEYVRRKVGKTVA